MLKVRQEVSNLLTRLPKIVLWKMFNTTSMCSKIDREWMTQRRAGLLKKKLKKNCEVDCK